MIKVVTDVTITIFLGNVSSVNEEEIITIFQRPTRNVKFNKLISISPVYITYSKTKAVTVQANIDLFLQELEECKHVNDYVGKVFPFLQNSFYNQGIIENTSIIQLVRVSDDEDLDNFR
ncbi:hypothetical protein, partial [Priestia megaterium]|uniref:hypothetical protein n=1 Tax=Priestia megaterium TaxID=1404 RepID=UPI003000E288